MIHQKYLLAAGGLLLAVGCKSKDSGTTTATCANPAPLTCQTGSVDAGAPVVAIPTTECIAATLRKIVDLETQAAALGVSSAVDPKVQAVAMQMAANFAADKSNLDGVESRNSLKEVACAATDTVNVALSMDLAALQAAAGPGFDHTFLTSQVAALTEAKRSINEDLIGWSNSGDLKTTIRFIRQRSPDGTPAVTAADFMSSAPALGIVPDLKALMGLLAGPGATPDGGAGETQ
jgi:Domain of unknown function (DUF4142)